MKMLSVFLMILALASVAAAETQTIVVRTTDVTDIVYHGKTLKKFDLVFPDDVDKDTFLSATLTTGVSPDELEDGLTEVAIAHLLANTPVIPAGKELPVSSLVAGADATRVTLELTPILEEVLAESNSSVTLVVGAITDKHLGDCSIVPLDGNANIWGSVEILSRKE